MKKNVPQKDCIKDKHKEWHFSEDQNQKQLSTPLNLKHTHNALTTQKSVAVYFKDVKTEETFSSQNQKLVETTNLWQLYWDKNTRAEIHLRNDQYPSRTEQMNKNEHSKMITSARHWSKMEKLVTRKTASLIGT